ncbi:MAG: tetratricopeptide repeat protein [Alistipes sp.]|nr:tetratricopeptide repeat protein [Alistipes sp.]
MRRKVVAIIFLLMVVLPTEVGAQYNRNYIYWMGQQCMVDNNYREAIDVLNVLLRSDDKDFDAYFLRGIAKYNMDDLLGADADFSRAVMLNPVFTGAFYYRAITRSRLGNYDDALSDFRQAIELRPDLPDPYYSRGVTRLLNQQFEAAIDDFNKYIRYEKRNVAAYINRGTSYLYLKDTARAFQDYDLAIRTNREDPDAYNRRGALLMEQRRYDEAFADFDMAVKCDSAYIPGYFNRALVNNYLRRPMASIRDFDRVVELDSTSSLGYFNRAIVRTEIGDYNRALEDFNLVARYSPDNVLLYYNRALLNTRLGEIDDAIADYSRAIELYPDFANAYLGRSVLRRAKHDVRGALSDERTAQRKISEYRSRLKDSTYSIYADTAQRFDKLLSFESRLMERNFERIASTVTQAGDDGLTLIPMFRFTLIEEDSAYVDKRNIRFATQRVKDFEERLANPLLRLDCRTSNVAPDSLVAIDRRLAEELRHSSERSWIMLFERGISQSLIKQYTNAVNTYSEAIELNPTNPFLYLNRATTRAEMIDFISSIDNSYQSITLDSDPAKRLHNTSTRTYSYDEAIEDMNKVIKLYPDFAEGYYNRANLMAISGQLPEAYDDYTRAIELEPSLGEAYYNRGLVQIFMKDTRKGCMDLSKAGELGIEAAYDVLRQFRIAEHN